MLVPISCAARAAYRIAAICTVASLSAGCWLLVGFLYDSVGIGDQPHGAHDGLAETAAGTNAWERP